MGEDTLLEKLIKYIGHIGWRVFVWAEWGGSEDKYHNAIEYDILTRNGITVCIVCGSKEHKQCDNFPI